MNSFDLFGNPQKNAYIAPNKKGGPVDFEVELIGNSDSELEEEETAPRHFYTLWLILGGIAFLLLAQCFRLQVDQNQANKALSEGNSLRYITLLADRGLIEDYHGNIIAQNSRQEALAVNPQTLPSKRMDRQKVYNVLRQKAAIATDILDYLEVHRLDSPNLYIIKPNLSKEDSLLYKEWFADLPGVEVQEAPIRLYADLPSLGQILGYVGSANEADVSSGAKPNQIVGKSGVEKSYDSLLAGTPGRQKAEVNAYEEVVRTLPSTASDLAKTGATLKLSLDEKLQKIVSDALKNELARRTKRLGAMPNMGASAVVVDPSTGAIRAMVSLPDYNDNLFAQGINQTDYSALLNDPGNPLLNRAIQGSYPPGSTIKPLIAAAGLQTGVIGPDTQMVTPAAINIGSFSFPDWKTHGLTNTRKAIAESNDIFFYSVGGGWAEKNFTGLGMDRMNSYLSQFGLGSKTGIDIGGETTGLLPDNKWKQATVKEPWYIGDTYHSSIGQGFTLATPLQMAVGTAAIANGGTTWQPSLAWSSVDPVSGKETLIPHKTIANGFVSPQNIQVVREGMRQAVQSGSARPLNTLKVTSAGKTGTAEFGSTGQMHAWYTGFAPYDNPEIAFSIIIEGGGDSYLSSVPVAEEILRNYFNDPLAPGQKLNSEPDLSDNAFKGEH